MIRGHPNDPRAANPGTGQAPPEGARAGGAGGNPAPVERRRQAAGVAPACGAYPSWRSAVTG